MHIRDYALEVFGVGCAIHESQVFYPDLKEILDNVPYFERAFGVIMALLFVLTVLLWLIAGLAYLIRKRPIQVSTDAPTQPATTQSSFAAVNSFAAADKLKTDSELRKQDLDGAYENFLGNFEGLRLLYQDDENLAKMNQSILAGFSPADYREARRVTEIAASRLREALDEFRKYLFPEAI